ncbi:MAG: AI-2E family transporter [Spirochaetes bacterium]|nr:AI-2E family transporter [Spirochaetota bacterium]
MEKIFASKTFKRLFPYFLLALAVIVAHRFVSEFGYFANIVSILLGIMTPFFYGLVIAYIANIPCSGIQRLLGKSKNSFLLKKKKGLSILIVAAIFLFILTLTLNLIIPQIVSSVSLFIASFPANMEDVSYFIDDVSRRIENWIPFELPMGFQISAEPVLEFLQSWIANFSLENLADPLNALLNFSAAIFTNVFTALIAIISAIYIILEKEKFKGFLCRLLKVFASDAVYNNTLMYSRSLNRKFRQYINTQTIDGLILGTIVGVVLSIMGSPYALVLGITLGVVNYIPYFGSIFGTLLAVLVVMFTQTFTLGLIAAAVLFVIQQIDANVIQPRLMSGSFALSPLLVIVSISIGGAAAGIFGMIVAIPIVAVIMEMAENVIAHFERKKFGQTEDGGGE